jgi:hypothetical protein
MVPELTSFDLVNLRHRVTIDTVRTNTVTIPIDPPVTLDAGVYRVKLDGGRVTFERQIDGDVCGPVGSKAPADPHTTSHSPPDA